MRYEYAKKLDINLLILSIKLLFCSFALLTGILETNSVTQYLPQLARNIL